MKAKCLALVVLGLSAFLGAGDPGRDAVKWQEPKTLWGEPNDGLRMGVAVTKRLFASGEPVIVGVRVQNLSDKPRELVYAGEGFWNISVTFGPDKAPARSIFDNDVHMQIRKGYVQPWRYGAGSATGALIEPGGTWYEVAPVSRYFYLPATTCTITISYPDHAKGGDAVLLQAPPVEIEVRDMYWADPPASQMLQLDWRAYGGIRGEQQIVLLSGSARNSTQLLAAFAQGHPDTGLGERARWELEQLHAQLDKLLKEERPKAGEKEEKAEAKPQAGSPAKQAEPEQAGQKAAPP